VRIGVVGIGNWGTKVLREYQELEQQKIITKVVTCDIDKSRNPDYTNFDEMLPNIDAIHICTNNSSHYELARKALDAGKHVMLEKPMTISSKDDIDIVELAKDKKLVLQVGFIWLHSNVIRKIKELIEHDFFGRIYYIKMRWSFLQPMIPNTDVIWDLLPHPISILLYFFGQYPLEISKISNCFRRKKLDEVAFIGFKFPLGILAHVELSWLELPKTRTLEIVGSKNSVFLDLQKSALGVEANNTILDEISYFVECIKGRHDIVRSGTIGAETTEIIEWVVNG